MLSVKKKGGLRPGAEAKKKKKNHKLLKNVWLKIISDVSRRVTPRRPSVVEGESLLEMVEQ